MPAMLFGHGPESVAPQGAPTDPTTPSVGAGHARDALRTQTGKHRARGRSYRLRRNPVGAGHARDAFRARTGEHRAPGRSYRPHHTTL